MHQNSAKGKVLIQYDPDEATLPVSPVNLCPLQQATLKVWVEDGPDPVYVDNWLAESNQFGGSLKHKRGGNTCSPPASTTSPKSTIVATATADLSCYNYVDPDQERGSFCTCTNGASLAVAASTGSNIGTAYQPCPWTTVPVSATTSMATSMSSKPTSDPPQYAFTTTKFNHDVMGANAPLKSNTSASRRLSAQVVR